MRLTNTKKSLLLLALCLWLPVALAENPFGQQFDLNKIIQQEINRDANFENLNVKAHMLDGYVTLEGYVDNIWQRDRLIEISQGVNGVKGVIDKLDIVEISIDSHNLAKAIALKLYRDEVADAYELKLITDNYGRVKLEGSVDSKFEKKAAEQSLKQVKGVRYTLNDLVVKDEGKRSDSEIEKDLEYALYDNTLIDERRLESKVRKNTAIVEGNVGSEREALVIEQISKEVAGVKDVRVTEVTVVPQFDRTIVFKLVPSELEYTDNALERAVDQANYYDTRVFSYNIDVEARNGVVRLSGVAKSEKAREAALENARNTIGVRDVIDGLSVDEFAPTEELLSE